MAERTPRFSRKPFVRANPPIVLPVTIKFVLVLSELLRDLLPAVVRCMVEDAMFPRGFGKAKISAMQRIQYLVVKVMLKKRVAI